MSLPPISLAKQEESGQDQKPSASESPLLPSSATVAFAPFTPMSQNLALKQLETTIADLRKENFNLRLTIFHLKDQLKGHLDSGREDLVAQLVELKVIIDEKNEELSRQSSLLLQARDYIEHLEKERENPHGHDLHLQQTFLEETPQNTSSFPPTFPHASAPSTEQHHPTHDQQYYTPLRQSKDKEITELHNRCQELTMQREELNQQLKEHSSPNMTEQLQRCNDERDILRKRCMTLENKLKEAEYIAQTKTIEARSLTTALQDRDYAFKQLQNLQQLDHTKQQKKLGNQKTKANTIFDATEKLDKSANGTKSTQAKQISCKTQQVEETLIQSIAARDKFLAFLLKQLTQLHKHFATGHLDSAYASTDSKKPDLLTSTNKVSITKDHSFFSSVSLSALPSLSTLPKGTMSSSFYQTSEMILQNLALLTNIIFYRLQQTQSTQQQLIAQIRAYKTQNQTLRTELQQLYAKESLFFPSKGNKTNHIPQQNHLHSFSSAFQLNDSTNIPHFSKAKKQVTTINNQSNNDQKSTLPDFSLQEFQELQHDNITPSANHASSSFLSTLDDHLNNLFNQPLPKKKDSTQQVSDKWERPNVAKDLWGAREQVHYLKENNRILKSELEEQQSLLQHIQTVCEELTQLW